MFTGIVEEMGTVKSVNGADQSGAIVIHAPKVLSDAKIGDSIAVNGVCLTVARKQGGEFWADVMPETLRRTNLGDLSAGDKVNLERAMVADGRFGGHIVAGHIDGTGEILSLKKEGNATWVSVAASPEILHYIIPKGSIAIDGISLTVAYVDEEMFKVSLIPHTGEETGLLKKKAGDRVNLENDLVGKYIEKLVQPFSVENKEKKNTITMEFLKENGMA